MRQFQVIVFEEFDGAKSVADIFSTTNDIKKLADYCLRPHIAYDSAQVVVELIEQDANGARCTRGRVDVTQQLRKKRPAATPARREQLYRVILEGLLAV